MSYQSVTIVGFLGAGPELRYTTDGTPVTNFSVATNRKWKNADGSQGEKTVWFKVAAWRRLAETCNEYLAKGRQVLVIGELEPAKAYVGRDGEPCASLEVTARSVKFLGGRGEEKSYEEPVAEDPSADIPF